MKILVDANIILSAHVFGSVHIARVVEFVALHHTLVVPQQVVNECVHVAKRKRLERVHQLESFFGRVDIQILPVSEKTGPQIPAMRDITDQPILEAAMVYDVDIILSGDKDFLALDLHKPRIMNVAQFLMEFMPKTT